MSPCATVPLHVFVLVWFYLSRRPWGRHEGFLIRGAEVCNQQGVAPRDHPRILNERKPETRNTSFISDLVIRLMSASSPLGSRIMASRMIPAGLSAMLVLFSRCGDVDGCGGGFFLRAADARSLVAAAPHTRMHTVVSPEVGAATFEIRKKEACKDDGTQERRPDATGTTERHWH